MIANHKKVFWTKVPIRKNIFLTPALKLGLIHDSSISGFSRDLFTLVSISPLFFLAFFFYVCTPSPEPINYGRDECEHCRMMITDNKYGAEIVTDKGKVYKFDSIECLIEFALDKKLVGDNNQTFLITNFTNPEDLIDARNAAYIHNDEFRSPMGLNVSAFSSEEESQKFLSENGGRKLNWLDVIELVKRSIM